MLKKRLLKQKMKRMRTNNKSRRIRHIYRLKRRIHARYRVGFMVWQQA